MMILEKINQDELNQIDSLYNEFVKKYVPFSLNLPKPKVQFKKLRKRLGLFHLKDNLITIDTDIANNPNELKATLWHELIHWYQWNSDKANMYKDVLSKSKGHGTFFKEMMNKINGDVGKNIISITSEHMESGKTKKKYYTYIIKNITNSYYIIFNSLTKKEQNIELLDKTLEYYQNKYPNISFEKYIFENDNLEMRHYIIPYSTIKTAKLYIISETQNSRFFEYLKSNEKNFQKITESTISEYYIYSFLNKEKKKAYYFWSDKNDERLKKQLTEIKQKYFEIFNIDFETFIFKSNNPKLKIISIKKSPSIKTLKGIGNISFNQHPDLYNELISEAK